MQLPPEDRETLIRRPARATRRNPLWAVLFLVLMTLLVMVVTGVVFVYLWSLTQTASVQLLVNGEARTLETRATTVEQLLNSYQLLPQPGDELSIGLDESLVDGVIIQLTQSRQVAITVDDQTQLLRTLEDTPLAVLDEAGIVLNEDDNVVIDGTSVPVNDLPQWDVPVSSIVVQHAVSVIVMDGDNRIDVRTTLNTVGDALFAVGVTLYVSDIATPDLNTPIDEGMTIIVRRATPAAVVVDGVTLDVRTQGDTVADLLTDARVVLLGLDYTIPTESTRLQPGMTVRVLRVTEEVTTETEIISFESVTQADPALEIDQLRIAQAGQNGISRTSRRIRYENGVEVSRTEQRDNIIQEPQNRIVTYGTGVVLRDVNTEQGTRQYWRKIRMLATSYHPEALGGDNVTATGRILTKGIVAIDPGVIPYGTEVYVPGYGIGLAADTGGPRSTRRWIDLGYDDDNWIPWAQWIDVYVLSPVPPNIQYILPE